MQFSRVRTQLSCFLTAGLLSLGLAACGDSGDGDTNTGTGSTTAAATGTTPTPTGTAPSTVGTTTPTTTDSATPTGTDNTATGTGNTLVDVALKDAKFSKLVELVQKAGLEQELRGATPLTLLAPTNTAFEGLPAGALDMLAADPAKLKMVLQNHLLDGKVMAAQVGTLKKTTSKAGNTLIIDTSAGTKIGGANVSQTDIEASNGIIHAIDSVILPPAGTIVDVVKADANLSTLVNAINKAELGDTLAGMGPFTLFAPSNTAFEGLEAGVLDGLLQDKPRLTDVLMAHVVDGETLAAELTNQQVLNTKKTGQSWTVTIEGGVVKIDKATVTGPNMLGTNGVIHVIDTVLVPPASTK